MSGTTVRTARTTDGASGSRTAAVTGPPAPAALSAPVTAAGVRDLRERAVRGPRRLRFAAGDLVVVSGLPGSGKSTLMRRVVRGVLVDSQDTRDGWARRLPVPLPYALYRPLVRLAHYTRLRRLLRTGAGVVVHDCGAQAWVRRWLAREARRRSGALHLLLLEVPPEIALAGQRSRARRVSRYAFGRHRRAVRRLVRAAEAGDPPFGCASVVLLDRAAADSLRTIDFFW